MGGVTDTMGTAAPAETAGRRMLIDWFSPLFPARSDIAHFTARLLPALAARADVRLWTDQTDYDRNLARYAQIIPYDPHRLDVRILNRADLVIYNMGNDARFHGNIREALFRVPGVLIAHELSYHHSIEWDYVSRRADRGGYLSLVERCYGASARQEAESYLMSGRPTLDDLARQYPFIDLLADAALAVVCHTQAVEDAVKARGIGTLRLPLAFQAPAQAPSKAVASGLLEFVQFGYIGPSRRLFAILAALSRFKGRHNFRLRIFGELWDTDVVRAEIRRRKLEDHVSIVGFVAEDALDDAITRADLVFNLRYPSVGEASGSQMRIWASGTPSVVTNTGWYGDLPDETVLKIEADSEAADLDRVLASLANDRFAYTQVGLNGLKHLARHHNPEDYVEKLLTIKDIAEKRRGLIAYRHLIDHAGMVADRLFGANNASMAKSIMSYRRKLAAFGE